MLPGEAGYHPHGYVTNSTNRKEVLFLSLYIHIGNDIINDRHIGSYKTPILVI